MAGKYRKFTPEFREEAARMVVETSRPIADVARELGINETSLGNWVRDYRKKHAGDEPPLQLSERARLRELERENRELRMKNDFLSKAAGVLRGGASVSDVYEFIDVEYATGLAAPAITLMCRWLEVSRSGYYEWWSRPESATAKRREELKLLVKKAFDDSDGTYGYRRVWWQLARWGVRAGLELVRALMRELGLVACQPRPWRPSTTQQGHPGPIPDLVNRDFTADAPGRKMVGDITYIPTWEGWVYLATVIDCATRKVAGWAMDDNYQTPLITSAIEMAARNLHLPADAVFHSDRGSNYTSAEFAASLERLGIRQSVGRTGICYDNALAESFNAALKVERVHRTAYPTRKKAKEDIARYIELRYNRTRLHSGLGYRTPQEALNEYLNQQLAA
ncbi:MAG TPA: IS3 family transposase [Terriglobales bacterium]|nr:IS3 family transposase [Terriglobales bacterium]